VGAAASTANDETSREAKKAADLGPGARMPAH
jgi:hypothetical protein